jgi:hypothetical protein
MNAAVDADDFVARTQSGVAIEHSAVHAAHVILDAVARSDGTRTSVLDELFRTHVRDGLLGDVAFDARRHHGDPGHDYARRGSWLVPSDSEHRRRRPGTRRPAEPQPRRTPPTGVRPGRWHAWFAVAAGVSIDTDRAVALDDLGSSAMPRAGRSLCLR